MPAKKNTTAIRCDFCGCLGATADDFGINVCDTCRFERSIEEVIARADGVIVGWQVDYLRQALAHARDLRRAGELLAAREALQAAWNLANGLFNAVESRSDVLTGNKVRTKAAEGNTIRSNEARKLHAEWQRRANEKWKEPQHSSKSANQVAVLIAEGNEKPDTIRRAIKRPRK